MSDAIRHATIVVDLVQGKAELKAPDTGPWLAARQKELELINQIEAGQKRLVELQNEMMKPGAGGPGGGAPGGGRAGSNAEETEKAAKAQQQLAAAYREAGEGVMRVTRGFVLLSGASDESLKKMVQGLAVVQGAYDLFAGSQKIIDNVAKAQLALAAATGTATAAQVALNVASKAFTTIANPITLALVAIASAVMACVEAYDYFTTSSEEAREAALAQAQATEILVASFQRQLDAERMIADLRRSTMSDVEKRASLDQARNSAVGAGNLEIELAGGRSPEAEKAARSFAAQQYAQAAAALKERIQLEQTILDKQSRQKDMAIEQIKRQEDLVKAAQRQVDVEKQKADAQQAQIGRLSTLQQAQLKSLRDKLLRGEDLSRGEESRLDEIGGEAGKGIVDARARKRAEAAGFGPDFFKGIEGASGGMENAAKLLKEAADALKSLTNGATAAAKIAELEAEKQRIAKAGAELGKTYADQIERMIALIKANADRLAELEITVAVNAASG